MVANSMCYNIRITTFLFRMGSIPVLGGKHERTVSSKETRREGRLQPEVWETSS